MKMRRSLMRLTVSSLALGLAVSATGEAEAASPNANINGQVNSNAQVSQQNGPGLEHRLSPVIRKIQSVENEVNILSSELESVETLTSEQI